MLEELRGPDGKHLAIYALDGESVQEPTKLPPPGLLAHRGRMLLRSRAALRTS